MNFYMTLASKNAKTGRIPVATVSRETCPTSCPLKNNGCYAENAPLRFHWDKVTAGNRGTNFDTFLEDIRQLPAQQVWRYGQAGDLPGEGDVIDADMLGDLVEANAGRPVIAYTHKPPNAGNLIALRDAAARGFSVNLSADDVEEADELADTGLPVVLTLPLEYARNDDESLSDYNDRIKNLTFHTSAGRKIAICPATYAKTTCGECLACSRVNGSEVIIGFPAHGPRARSVDRHARRCGAGQA